MISQRVLLGFFIACLLTTTVMAEPHPAQQLVEETTTELLILFKSEKAAIEANGSALREIVAEKVLPHFDFVRMSKLALGKHWRRATVAQRKAFAVQFRELLVNTYAKALYRYADAEVSHKTLRAEVGDRYVDVASEVDAGGEPVDVTYRLYEQGDTWKVFNITIQGVSLITNYRSTFSSFIGKNGIDALVADLERRNRLGATGDTDDESA